MKRIILILFAFQLFGAAAQETKKLTIEDVINTASKQSLEAFKNKNMYLSKYWEYRNYKADRLPSLNLDVTPFNFNRLFEAQYIESTDQYEYRPKRDINSNFTLSLNQNVALTGGQFFLTSSLGRLKNLGGDKNTSYSSSPINIGYMQSLNGYNEQRWKAKTEPLKFEKAKKEYVLSREELALAATNKFFNLLDAQIEVNIAEKSMSNADTLYQIGKGRFQVGTVTQDELLNLELGVLNAKLSLNRANLGLERARSDLNSFLGLDKDIILECILPDKIADLQIQFGDVINKAIENNPEILDQKYRLLEEDRKVAEAKSKNGINADLFAEYGLNQNADNFSDVYQDPVDRQSAMIRIKMPILDWGKRKGSYLMAKSNREVVNATIRQARIDFEQDVFMNVMEFNLQSDQVVNAAKADTIAQLGYEVTKRRFLIGKVDVTKLNLAQQDLERSKRNYISSLRSYWQYYYTIRKLTLFDFEQKVNLTSDFDRMLQEM